MNKIKRGFNRLKLVADLIECSIDSVLELGCGNREIKTYLPEDIHYQGIDLKESEEVVKWDLEKGLPFKDNSFDVVIGLNILEHLENCHFVFKEMMRVAKKEVIVGLPNMYFWGYRLKYLLGKPLLENENASFTPQPQKDRHRYNPSYSEAIKFIEANVERNCKIRVGQHIYSYRRLKFLRLVDWILSRFWPNLFVHEIIIYIDLNKNYGTSKR